MLDTGLQARVIEVADLNAAERARWAALRAAEPMLAGPYFDLRYAEAAAACAPGSRVAVLEQGGRVVGFLPFQRRGSSIQPLGAPMSDFHGLVAEPGVSLPAVLALLGAERMRVSGLVSPEPLPELSVRYAMAADLSGGFEAYQATRSAAFLKDKRRRARALERDHGQMVFTFERPALDLLAWLVAQKRAQIRRTHQHDIFACGWTIDLLNRLAESDAPDFGLRLAVLRAGGTIVAAELGLTAGDRHHLWFPIYDPAFSRYSPGALMTLETLRAAAERGVARVDFGPSEEAYKEDFAVPMEPVLEGAVAMRPSLMTHLRGAPGADRIDEVGRRLARRLDRIAACEPGLIGQVKGGASFVTGLGRRHPAVGAGIGVGIGLGLSLGLLAD
ncbi:GNAT family N-acetyltransferase [Caulobacter sp. 602-2]|uniref:GNAT family N-acetyltransferase n=1 Tax=Caulobacter sp. 602-2 TaxID=2710887 RepID=A0A6G4R418_9CAUL|nr:GNAT family N-acetyltransferase [Caulobacter sp. 602-2]